MKKTSFLLGIAFFLCYTLSTSAKEKKVKFGKIDKEYLEATQCPIDSNAHAYYIYDEGHNYFEYNNGFSLIFEHHLILKILDESAFDEATFEIPIYIGSSSGKEKLTSIKANTYNLENGETVISKLDRKNIITENKNNNYDKIKFTLPNVKKGSVIEVEYKLSSDFWFNLTGWYFQYQIPVLESIYDVRIPEYYTYSQYPHGYIDYHCTPSRGSKTITTNSGTATYSTQEYSYYATNVPAFPTSEYLTSIDNYISHIEFELSNVSIPGAYYKNYSMSWANVSKRLTDLSDLGQIIKQNRCFNDIASAIKLSSSSETEQMAAAFSYINGKTKWNEYYSIATSQSIKKTMETGIGNSADINLSLVALLNNIGLQAYPVVLSTRSNGFVNLAFPSLNKFNYVIALCIIDNKKYLMDATNDYSGINIIPTRCLNNKGLVVNGEKEQWVSLNHNPEYKNYCIYTLDINEDGTFSGQIVNQYSDYATYLLRNEIKSLESTDKYIESLEEDNTGLTIKKDSIENLDSLNKNIKEIHTVEIKNKSNVMGDLITFSPTLYDGIYTNPLKLEERMYPVEYRFRSNETISATYTIPEGYTIESLPKSIMYKSESGSCTFKFIIQSQGSKISVLSQYKRNQIIFPYNQYQELRQFYEAIVQKHNEKIVLKKQL